MGTRLSDVPARRGAWRTLGAFLAALAIALAAFYAFALGYSLAVCTTENPAGWALLLVLVGAVAMPSLAMAYLLAAGALFVTLRAAGTRFGAWRVAAWTLPALVALVGVVAAGTMLLGLHDGCNVLG